MADEVVTKRGEGEALWAFGMLLEVLVPGDKTNDTVTVIEMTLRPGPFIASPLHMHEGNELVHVLEGEVRYHVGDRVVDLAAGSTLHIPAGTWEWGENVTARPARMLVTYSPGGIDRFFREVGETAKSRQLPPAGPPPDFARLTAIGKKYRMALKRPPSSVATASPRA